MKQFPSKTWFEKAVRGAIKNALHAHPSWKMDNRLVTSIAKRAAGTLAAEMTPLELAVMSRHAEAGVARTPAEWGGGANPTPSLRGSAP